MKASDVRSASTLPPAPGPSPFATRGRSLFPVAALIAAIAAGLVFPLSARCLEDPAERGAVPSDYKRLIETKAFKELYALLASDNPAERAYAAIALRYEPAAGHVPHLLTVLGDDTPLGREGKPGETSPSEEAQKTGAAILRHVTATRPANIVHLNRIFLLAREGGPTERIAAIEILGALDDPVAAPFLRSMSSDADSQVAQAASDSLARVMSPAREGGFPLARRRQVVSGAALIALAAVSLVILSIRQWKRPDGRLLVLSLSAALLTGLFGYALLMEFSRSRTDAAAVEQAVLRADATSLARKLSVEQADYPGDSRIARRLVAPGDVWTAHALSEILRANPGESLERRVRWVLARLVVISLETSGFHELVESPDPDVRFRTAETLGLLGVKDDRILGALRRLASDTNESVRTAAERALEKAGQAPLWAGRAKEPS